MKLFGEYIMAGCIRVGTQHSPSRNILVSPWRSSISCTATNLSTGTFGGRFENSERRTIIDDIIIPFIVLHMFLLFLRLCLSPASIFPIITMVVMASQHLHIRCEDGLFHVLPHCATGIRLGDGLRYKPLRFR